ncbi:hypothetical protein OL548_23475 [Lysinibacillus sp. MHQ-1]|nr:hypothetical protein OL548_23475 [Lysinibacillus sp. MHQ-1]
MLKNQNGKIIGFGLSILGPENLLIGPIVAPNSQTAALIIDGLVINHQGKIRIDVPSSNDELMLFLEKSGFIKVSNPPIMIKNSIKMPYRNKELFAIAAQIFWLEISISFVHVTFGTNIRGKGNMVKKIKKVWT